MENEKEFLETEEAVEPVLPENAEEATQIPEEDNAEPILVQNEENTDNIILVQEEKKSGTVKVVLITVISTILALALLGAMAYLVLKGAGILEGKPEETEPAVTEPTVAVPDHTYTVDDATIVTMFDNVVAKAGEMQLHNSLMQLYYESSIITYQNQLGMYLYYLGVDFSQPLDTQIYDDATGETWQDMILEAAMQTWHACVAVKQYAAANGYTPKEEDLAYLADIDNKIQEMVVASGCTSAEQLVKEQIAVGATVEDLRTYMELDFYYADYIEYLQEVYAMTDEEAIQYYTENEEVLNQNNISKENGDVVDIRHVLIQLDDSETDEMGQVVYTNEQWEACRVKAQEIYDSWLSGEATEDTFAQLAKDHSKDGNAAQGGIYTDVTKGAMVETFDAWIFDESRVTGDSGLVKTPFGYHIMYFVNRKAKWVDDTRKYVISENINKIIKEAMETYPLETYMDQVGVSH